MAANTVSSQAQGSLNVAPTLGEGMANLDALKENATAMLDHLLTGKDLGLKEYQDQGEDYKQVHCSLPGANRTWR